MGERRIAKQAWDTSPVHATRHVIQCTDDKIRETDNERLRANGCELCSDRSVPTSLTSHRRDRLVGCIFGHWYGSLEHLTVGESPVMEGTYSCDDNGPPTDSCRRCCSRAHPSPSTREAKLSEVRRRLAPAYTHSHSATDRCSATCGGACSSPNCATGTATHSSSSPARGCR